MEYRPFMTSLYPLDAVSKGLLPSSWIHLVVRSTFSREFRMGRARLLVFYHGFLRWPGVNQSSSIITKNPSRLYDRKPGTIVFTPGLLPSWHTAVSIDECTSNRRSISFNPRKRVTDNGIATFPGRCRKMRDVVSDPSSIYRSMSFLFLYLILSPIFRLPTGIGHLLWYFF